MRIQQLEEKVAKNPQSGSMSQSIQQQFQAHDAKLAEYSLQLDAIDCKNTEGVLLWKIREMRRQRRDAAPSISSQPFYTSANGYKMQARMFLNGDGIGQGTHLSLFFKLLRGDYDSLLPWPFQQKVTLVLLDQDGHHHISDTFMPDPCIFIFIPTTTK